MCECVPTLEMGAAFGVKSVNAYDEALEEGVHRCLVDQNLVVVVQKLLSQQMCAVASEMQVEVLKILRNSIDRRAEIATRQCIVS